MQPLIQRTLAVTAGLVFLATTASAALVVPGANGSDGALNIEANTVIDLSQAVTAAWDSDNTANAGKGVYDAGKWAVVFKYSSITVAPGAVVTFKNHPSRAPVVWLVNGDVNIQGTVRLNGANIPQLLTQLAEPGPGGFRGGGGKVSEGAYASAGFGVGGGRQGPETGIWGVAWWQDWRSGHSGSYGTLAANANPSSTYGNPSMIPLLGGSGGAGSNVDGAGGGGAGGGAILIAATGSITLTGSIEANGGRGINSLGSAPDVGNGSGGGIRLVGDSVSGTGALQALGGVAWYAGGNGRIRLERVQTDGQLQVTPDPSVVPLQAGDTVQLWVPETGPSVRVVSIGGLNAPEDPRATFGAQGADVALPQTSSIPVVVETTNVEDASVVKVRVTPRNGNFVEANATLSEVVSTSPRVIRWTAQLPVGGGYSALQVRVIRP